MRGGREGKEVWARNDTPDYNETVANVYARDEKSLSDPSQNPSTMFELLYRTVFSGLVLSKIQPGRDNHLDRLGPWMYV
ncbi:hypothetical protein RRG08_051541 [Elysia crispata]|uniref:Uncharacterized protein n=1 Tax=Elysia crispata TaxID=231223 RepID=A0AAE0Y838_9GAST|nr:hypothetical protein RRG08_051541 [Elysia crispata]